MSVIAQKIICYDAIDSTNNEAKRLISQGAGEGLVVVAGEQSSGRGKPGKAWFSPPQSGIYLSAIVKPKKNSNELVSITQLGAKAVVKLIKENCGLDAAIKQPNDVLLNGKKICGILVERLASGHIIIGLGLNVNNQPGSFSQELQNLATSLAIETGQVFDLKKIQANLLALLDQEYIAYLS